MKILQIIGTMRKEYGGPSFSAAAISQQLRMMGHESNVLVLDSYVDSDVAADSNIYTGARMGRFGFAPGAMKWLEENPSKFDHMIVHGIWQYQSLLARRFCARNSIPYVAFVHGALDPWFRKRYPFKHLKKAFYWNFIERTNLRAANKVLFTSVDEVELAAIDFQLDGLNKAIVPYGITDPNPVFSYDELLQKRAQLSAGKVVFVSRIHAKKGLDLLIRAVAGSPVLNEISTTVAGSSTDGEDSRLKRLALSLGVSERFKWVGMVHGGAKWELYETSSLFCLPSHSENFGLVVAEALACGCPVLITNKVNIWREVYKAGAGIVVDDSIEGITQGLNEWLALEQKERCAMAIRARSCFEQNFRIENTAKAILEMLEQ